MAIIRFPEVSGSNLLREKVRLPGELAGQYNVVLVAFQQWQQSQVDTWVPALSQLEQAFPGLAYYEIPTIYRMNRFSRTFINEGMRAGIPNQKTRGRTITLYLDKEPFRRSLGIDSEEEISALLIDREGEVYWRAMGTFDDEKGRELAQVLAQYIPPAFETIWSRA